MEKNHLKSKRRKLFLSFFALAAIFLFLFLSQIETSSAQMGVVDSGESFADTKKAGSKDACVGLDTWMKYPIICLLLSLARFIHFLLEASSALFGQMVDVQNFQNTVNNPVIYLIWQQVRDLLNIAFIMVLLFSAFATIFQVEKYSYKKILLRLVIMALLINFSFPITRFIIDISNSLMYTLITVLFSGQPGGAEGVLSGIAKSGGLSAGLSPTTTNVSSLLAIIVFTFILAVCLLAVGVLMVIRIVALAILIIFSPIAFVGAILPDTGGISSKWWNYLFRYSFFGPMMIFMIYIASELMGLGTEQQRTWIVKAAANSTEPALVTAIAFFSIPIVLLIIGMKVATSMSIAGAGTVMSYAQKTGSLMAKSPLWAGKYGYRGAAFGVRKAVATKDAEGNIVRRGWSQKLFGDSVVGKGVDKMMRRSYTKADARKADSKGNKEYQAMLNNLSEKDRIKEFESSFGYKKFLAGQSIVKSGGHKKMDRAKLDELNKTLSQRGDVDSTKKISDDRWDVDLATIDPVKFRDRIMKHMANDDHKKNMSEAMLDNAFIDKLITTPGLGVDTATKMISEMPNVMRARTETLIQNNLKSMSHTDRNDATNVRTMNWRKIGASASIDAHKYFSETDSSGNLQNKIHASMTSASAAFFSKKTGKQFADYTENALEEIGEVVNSTAAFESAIKSINSAQARRMRAGGVKNVDPEVKKFMVNDRVWSTIT